MTWAPTRRRQLAAIPLLCLCGLVFVADFFVLGVAVAFGPEGFGGDGTVSSGRAALEHSGQLAGAVGLALAVIALIVFAAMVRHPRRNKVLASVVGVQSLMLIWLVASGL